MNVHNLAFRPNGWIYFGLLVDKEPETVQWYLDRKDGNILQCFSSLRRVLFSVKGRITDILEIKAASIATSTFSVKEVNDLR